MSNIKVCLRIKPQLLEQKAPSLPILLKKREGSNKVFFKHRNDTKIFTFDEIFEEGTSQLDLYNQLKEDLVGSALTGYNYCLMAYGQTSSGKTHTLLGDSGENRGILPRFVEDLFRESHEQHIEKMEVKCSFFEIYNEAIFDLLNEDETKVNLNLREDPKKGVFVEGLHEEHVNSLSDALKYFERGLQQRSTAETRLNDRSSRSHGIFTLKIEYEYKDDEDATPIKDISKIKRKKIRLKKRSVVHIVDLAGSERQQDFDPTRMKESCQINKSLGVLSNVITSLTKEGNNKGRYLHFRDSKLTFYLRDVFGGNSKTSIITNILNEESFYFETFNTLKFSATAKTIKTFPKANFVAEGSEEELQAEINRLMRKLSQLKRERSGVSNKEVVSVVKRLKNAWDDASNTIKENDLLTKDLLLSFDKSISELIQEINVLTKRGGIAFIFRTDIGDTLESIENFFDEKRVLKRAPMLNQMEKIEKKVKLEIRKIRDGSYNKLEELENKTGLSLRESMVSPHYNVISMNSSRQQMTVGEGGGDSPGKRKKTILENTDTFNLEEELQKMQSQPFKQLGSYSHEYVKSLINRNQEYEDKILELNHLNSEFIKEFSQNVEGVEAENSELKEMLINYVEKVKAFEEELFEYQNGRPLSEEEVKFRKSEFAQIRESVKNGSILSSVAFSKDGSRKSSTEIKDYGLPDNCFDQILFRDFSKKGGEAIVDSQTEGGMDINYQIDFANDVLPILDFGGETPKMIQTDRAADGRKRVWFSGTSQQHSLKVGNLENKSQKNSIFSQQHNRNSLLESLCKSKDEVIRTLKNQLSSVREEEFEAVNAMRDSMEGDFANVRRLEIKYNEAQEEIQQLKNELLNQKPARNARNSSNNKRLSNGIDNNYFYPGALEKSPLASVRKIIDQKNSKNKGAKSRHSSVGRMKRDSNKNELSQASEEEINGRKSFLSQRLINNRLAEEGLETNLRVKNREIIFYLKEINKLQNENESLRGNAQNTGQLKVYKLQLQNRKLKESLKKFMSKKNTLPN